MIPNLKLSNSKIRQQIWSNILNNTQEPKDLKRYNGNKNNWRNSKENCTDAIYSAQFDFMLKSNYVPPYKSDPYTCNTSDLADEYIFKILDLNITTSNSHQCRNALVRFHKEIS